MKTKLLMLALLLSCGFLKAQIIIPMPVQYEFSEMGSFVIDDKTVIEISDESLVATAQMFSKEVESLCGLDLLKNDRGRKKVKLKINSYMPHPDSYNINVSGKAVQVTGGSEAGVYYGVLMLIQCMMNEYASVDPAQHTVTFPLIIVEDTPLFTFRALEWRNPFVPSKELKDRVVYMSELNLNTYVVPMDYNELVAYVLSDKQKWYGLSEYALKHNVHVVPKVVFNDKMVKLGADSVAAILDRMYDIFPSEFVQMEFGGLDVGADFWGVLDSGAEKRQKTLIPDKTALDATMVAVPLGGHAQVDQSRTLGEIIVVDMEGKECDADAYNVMPIKRKSVNKTYIPLNGVQFVINSAAIDEKKLKTELMPFCSETAWTKSELKSFDDFNRRREAMFNPARKLKR